MIDWLIIGGGIHGTYLSNLLIHQEGITRDDVRVIDPHAVPLYAWIRTTRNCGMDYLRSPATHNIDMGIMSLHQYAKSEAGRPYADFIAPYYRPSLTLFQKHCEAVIARNRLDRLRISARATALKNLGRTMGVDTTHGSFTARNVILAVGQSDQPYWPAWAHGLRAEGRRIDHVFDTNFQRERLEDRPCTAVVGGGITALQTALKLTQEFRGDVLVISRHPLRQSAYDFDPCWIGPKCLRGFHQTALHRRRDVIAKARQAGTAPVEVIEAFEKASRQGRPGLQIGRIQSAVAEGDRIRISLDGANLMADQILLATGFSKQRPGGRFIDQVIREFGLKLGPCGYPAVATDLRWNEHIFTSGALAELQLGPCARNIVGVRNAGRCILGGLGRN